MRKSSRARRSSNKAVVGIPLGGSTCILSYSFLFKLLFCPFIFTRGVYIRWNSNVNSSLGKILFFAGILNAPELSGLKQQQKLFFFLSVCKVGHTSSVDRFRKKMGGGSMIKCPERKGLFIRNRAVVSCCIGDKWLDGESWSLKSAVISSIVWQNGDDGAPATTTTHILVLWAGKGSEFGPLLYSVDVEKWPRWIAVAVE